jgi:CIC family chloride channel protein
MMAAVLATLLAEIMFPHSIYTLKLALRGIHLTAGRAEDVLASVPVSDVMEAEVDTIPAGTTLEELAQALRHSHHHGYPIIDEQRRLRGIVTLTDVDRALHSDLDRSTPVMDFATPRSALLTVTPDASIGEALQQMGRRGFGRVPVVDADNPDRLLGLIRRESIITAYNLALTRRAEGQHRTKQLRRENLDGTEFVDVVLQPEDRAVGRTIQELAAELPYECVLVSVRRAGRLLIPHGSTQLEAGDRVTAFVSEQAEGQLFGCLQGDRPVSGH